MHDSHYPSFPQMSLIAVHLSNHDVGVSMCSTDVQVSQVVIEGVNTDYGAPSDMFRSGEHVLICLDLQY